MKKLLFILLWSQLSDGCHKDLTRTTRKKFQQGIRRRRGGRSNTGEDYMSTCMDEQEMSNHCNFLSCHHGDRYLPGPMPCSPQFCQCGAHGGAPHPMKCGEGTVFKTKVAPSLETTLIVDWCDRKQSYCHLHHSCVIVIIVIIVLQVQQWQSGWMQDNWRGSYSGLNHSCFSQPS